jgi:hypothetical protein
VAKSGHIDLKEDAYESSTFVYCKKVVILVLKMCVGRNVDDESSQREGFWNDDKERHYK